MGYYTTLDGQINFDPPANHGKVEQIEKALGEGDFYGSVKLNTETLRINTDAGVLHSKTADAIVPTTDESHKTYTINRELEAIVSRLPGRTFSGQILWEGEESGDVGRYMVVDGFVREQKAKWSFD